jgi:hypothetical protein
MSIEISKKNSYCGLMAERNDNVDDIVSILGISDDSVRRTLKGERDFTLTEVIAMVEEAASTLDSIFTSKLKVLGK